MDVWEVGTAEDAEPHLLVTNASSPSVVPQADTRGPDGEQ